MRLFGLIGYPLSHSFSQQFFTEKFEKEAIKNCRYLNFPISSIEELRSVINENPGLEGLNVTIPYKEQVLLYLDEISETVQEIGACNCIKIKQGILTGYNTDVPGFEASFVKELKPYHKQALVLGTGGASKAVQYVLAKLAISFKVVSRNPKGDEIGYEAITSDNIGDYLVIINTTPLGMQPVVHQSPSLPYSALGKEHYLFDLIYNPAKTVFLESGEKYGAVIKNGYEMLVNQAEESWKIWNG
jgi:shikimate dehydrogenase